MSGYVQIVPARGWMEPARTAAAAAVLDAYSAVGTPIDNPCRIDSVYNLTDGHVWISLDGINDHFLILTGGAGVTDRAAAGVEIPAKTQFYVKRYTAGVVLTGDDVVISTTYRV